MICLNEILDEKAEITFEDVASDPDIALIGDDIGSREELIKAFLKYTKLSQKDKRFSDYYSMKFYGYNVPAMFTVMRRRFKGEMPIPTKETLLLSEPDLYYNKEAFDKGEINLCFVIGYSGSGKSVLTREYKGKGIEKVELDDIVCVKDHYSLEKLHGMGDLLYEFFSGCGSEYYMTREERDLRQDHSKVFVDFIKFAIEYASTHKEKKFILEGIWTYLFFDDPSDFKDYAVFMKGTSLVKSRIRRLKREASVGAVQTMDRLLEFGIYATDSMLHDSNVDKWRHYFEKQPSTIFKDEDSKLSDLKHDTLNKMNEINDRFVHGDKAGIESILNKVSSDESLDKIEKAVILEDCRKALAIM